MTTHVSRGVDLDRLVVALAAGSRRALARAITLLEDQRPRHLTQIDALLERLLPLAGKSARIAISGPPGVGKSTFIEAFGQLLLQCGHKIAVLAIDPSSPVSGGSILGDRVRMATLSGDSRVFIRPSPSSGNLGGVARQTRATISACEAAGYDMILVETVGVGQSELQAATMTDVCLILHLPNSGDDLQGIKRGILELADLVAVTKADGATRAAALVAQNEITQALHLARGSQGHNPPVIAVSAISGDGLPELLQSVGDLIKTQQESGAFAAKRQAQVMAWYHQEIIDQLQAALQDRPDIVTIIENLRTKVRAHHLPAPTAARQVVEQLLPRKV